MESLLSSTEPKSNVYESLRSGKVPSKMKSRLRPRIKITLQIYYFPLSSLKNVLLTAHFDRVNQLK